MRAIVFCVVSRVGLGRGQLRGSGCVTGRGVVARGRKEESGEEWVGYREGRRRSRSDVGELHPEH